MSIIKLNVKLEIFIWSLDSNVLNIFIYIINKLLLIIIINYYIKSLRHCPHVKDLLYIIILNVLNVLYILSTNYHIKSSQHCSHVKDLLYIIILNSMIL